MTESMRRLLAEYRAWVQRVILTRDAVRHAYGPRELGYQFADDVSCRRVLQLLKQPANFPNTEVLHPSRRGRPILRLMTDDLERLESSRSESWERIEHYLFSCPEHLQAAVVCAFVHGDSISEMTRRTGWSPEQARRFRQESVEYLRNAEQVVSSNDRPPTTGLEQRSYPPSTAFSSHANAGPEIYERAARDRLAFWADEARELWWDHEFDQVLDWSNPPFARWFVGGRTNVAVNCVDRHVDAGHGSRVAIHWVGQPGERRDITYRELQREVAKAANFLTDQGVVAGDRVAIHLPIVPEAIIAMLACARLGAIHVVVFVGCTADALRAQLEDAGPAVVVTSDGQYRHGASVPLKSVVDEALAARGACATVRKVIVVERTGRQPQANWVEGRDVWWHETVGVAGDRHQAQSFDSEHPLFVLYTANSEGKYSGIVHSSGGYLAQVRYTFHYVFDHRPGEDVFWCVGELGCIAGHSYVVYGPLADGATSVVYEGGADYTNQGRHFPIIEEYGVTTYYASSALVRIFVAAGREAVEARNLSSLRLLGVMGDRMNPEDWRWYREVVGGSRCPIVTTWWRAETGAIMIAPLPGVTAARPGSPVAPLPGVSVHIVDEDADLVALGEQGELVLDRPWPSMMRGIWGDSDRFVDSYWSQYAGRGWCVTGVDAGYDDEDTIWILSRGHDVLTVSGHHIYTAAVESALISHGGVSEAAVIGAADEDTGLGIVAFVILRDGSATANETLLADLRSRVVATISPDASPREIRFVPELLKTRSGKIMRHLLTDVAEGRTLADTSALVDPAAYAAVGGRTH